MIGSYHNLRILLNLQYLFLVNLQRLQAVRSVVSGGKFYRLPPDMENTVIYDSESGGSPALGGSANPTVD